MAEIDPDALQDNAACQGFIQHLVDESLILGREFGQGLREFIGNGKLGGNCAGKVILVRFGIERETWQFHRNSRRRQPHIVTGQGRDGQAQLIGQ